MTKCVQKVQQTESIIKSHNITHTYTYTYTYTSTEKVLTCVLKVTNICFLQKIFITSRYI